MVRRRGAPVPRGAALALVVLLLLALTLMGHGLLVLAAGEARSSGAGGRAISERLVARAALETGITRLLAADSLPRLAAGSRSALAVSPGRLELEGASSEVVLLEASAGGRSGRSLVAGVWGLDPVVRAAAGEAVAAAGGFVSAPPGAIQSAGFWDGSGEPSCVPLQPRLDSLEAELGLPRKEGRLSLRGPEGGLLPPPVAARTLGLLGPDSLARRLAALPSGTVTPRPSITDSTCVPETENWGSPTDVEGPCGVRRVGLSAPGPLEIRGGEGQGLLVVEGDLLLDEGSLFAGLLLVGGDLTVAGGSTLRGAARVGGNIHIHAGSAVVGAACPVALGLASLPDLLRPLRIPEPPVLLH